MKPSSYDDTKGTLGDAYVISEKIQRTQITNAIAGGMGVKHGLGIGCFAFVIGFGMAQLTEDGTLLFCWICAMPLILAGIGFFVPDKDNTVVVHSSYTPRFTGDVVDGQRSFREMDTDGDGVISPEEYNQ